jgi:hypothetical protein
VNDPAWIIVAHDLEIDLHVCLSIDHGRAKQTVAGVIRFAFFDVVECYERRLSCKPAGDCGVELLECFSTT